MASSLQRPVELDVLQRFYSDLNSKIIDPNIFANQLISKGFTTKLTATNKMPLGLSNYEKVSNLLGVAEAHIKSIDTREKFGAFLSILGSHDLGLQEIAEQMKEACCMLINNALI